MKEWDWGFRKKVELGDKTMNRMGERLWLSNSSEWIEQMREIPTVGKQSGKMIYPSN